MQRANKLYKFVAQLTSLALTMSTVLSIENPERSWFWACLADCFRKFSLEESKLFNSLQHVSFDNCAWGGNRPKSTRWLSTRGAYSRLELQCPGESSSHVHLPYSVEWTDERWKFDTAGEGSYPIPLCKAAAVQASEFIGWRPPPLAVRPSDEYRQTKKSRQLLPEFRTVIFCRADSLPAAPHKILGPSSGVLFGDLGSFPPGSTPPGALREVLTNGKRWTFSESGSIDQAQRGTLPDSVCVGIYNTHAEFVHLASALSHPMDTVSAVSDCFKRAMFKMLTTPPTDLAAERSSFIKHVLDLRAKLEPREKQLHQSMPVHMRRVMRGKKILLLRELLSEYGYDDLDVCDLLSQGVPFDWHARAPGLCGFKNFGRNLV